MNHQHTPEVVFDDDLDRQTATCTGCGSELQRLWLPTGTWSGWFVNARSQTLIGV